MGHPALTNGTSFFFDHLFLADEEGRFVCTLLVMATYEMRESGITLKTKQPAIVVAGQYTGEPGLSSVVHEPQMAFTKLSTDVVLLGHAHAKGATSIDVGLKVGPVQKVVRVFGDRYWVKTGGQVFATKPQPFDKMPLIYERAFGGWDKSNKDEKTWTFEARNPVGRGFGDPLRYVDEGKVPMPNLEDPNHLIKRYGEAPPPAGFGSIAPNWQPRAKYAGTYDKTWDKERKPLLPKDFDRRFFNAASPGLIAPGYLRGNEEVVVVNAAPVTPIRFKLPDVLPQICRISLRGNRTEEVRTNLDTVTVNTDDMSVSLLWRAFLPLRNGPHDVVAIDVAAGESIRQATTARQVL